MIIGVGCAGYHMASTIRREATAEAFKTAEYVFADQDKLFHDLIVENEEDGYIYLDLIDIDLDIDIPSDFFQEIEKVYVVAGMGGNTGTKWTPIISQYAKKKGNNVTAIVSEPFAFEGMKKMAKAKEGIAEIADSEIDRLITMKCEELYKRYTELDFFNAFLFADKAILNIIEETNMGTYASTETTTMVNVDIESEERQTMDKVAPKGLGKLDMVIAFDTT